MLLKVIDLNATVHNQYLLLVSDGVMGIDIGNGKFSEESNFHIDQVVMKVKIKGMEAGWIVRVSDVTGEEEDQ